MSAAVIAVPTAAGSAGKTTTVVSLATILGARGRRVLVIDGDPQATATEWLGVDPDEPQPHIGAVLLRRSSLDADSADDLEASLDKIGHPRLPPVQVHRHQGARGGVPGSGTCPDP